MLLPLLLGCSTQILHTTHQTLPAADLRTLRFDIAAGDALFIADDAATDITAEVTVGAVLGPAQDGCEVMDAFELVLDAHGEEAVLEVGFVGLDNLGAWADLVVTGPSHLLLAGADTSGDAEFSGFAGLTLHDNSGDLSVFHMAGDVNITDDSGDIWIDGVGGSLTIVDGSGDLNIYGVAGDVDITDDSGDIRVESVGGLVQIIDGSGDIRISDAADTEIIADGSGDVRVD